MERSEILKFLLIVLMPMLGSCEYIETGDLLGQPTTQGSDSGFEFLRNVAPLPPGAEVWITVQRVEDRGRDYSSCADSLFSPECGAGGATIVAMSIHSADSSFPAVADVVEIDNDVHGSTRTNRIRVRAYEEGGTDLRVESTRDGSADNMVGSHTVLVRQPAGLFVGAYCGVRSLPILLPGSEGAGGAALTNFREVVVQERASSGLQAVAAGLQADGSFMAGTLELDADPGLLDGETVPLGEYSIRYPGTGAEIPVTVVPDDAIDGISFVPLGVVKVPGGPADFARVPATTVPFSVDERFWPEDARNKTTIFPLPTAAGKVVCGYQNRLPDDSPLPLMNSLTPDVCEVSEVTPGGGGVDHLSTGECEVEITFQNEVRSVRWVIE